MSNVLSEEKKQQVIALGKLGWPLRRIEKATGVRRETAGAYLKAAGIAVDGPGRRSSAKPAIRVATDSEDSKAANDAGVATDFIRPFSQKPPLQLPAPKLSTSECEPFRETIELGLSRGRNAVAIWQDMVTSHGFSGAYNTVKRFVRKLRGSKQPEAVGIILTGPGEELQVDYGTGPMVRDPQTGKYRRTRLFVMTLGYSRKSVRLLVFRSSTRTWAELHETAFRRLGGSCSVLVLDNLKEGVVTPDIYDPTLNPLFKDVRQERGRHRIQPEDNPKKTPFTTAQLLARTARAGSHIGAFCKAIHDHKGEPGIRGILGVLSLAKKFGVTAVEDACAAALELCVYEYRFVRRYLERRPQLTLRQVDPLIRELVQYRDLINTKIQEQNHESD